MMSAISDGKVSLSRHPLKLQDLQQNQVVADSYILEKISKLKNNGWWKWMMEEYDRESSENPDNAYPSQGLRSTEYDGADLIGKQKVLLKESVFAESIQDWLYYLELFNHPQRLSHLLKINHQGFHSLHRKFNPIFFLTKVGRRALSIDELALHAQGSDKPRRERKKRFEEGPFVMLGRQARTVLVGSANPEVWGSAPAIASMAMAHCLVGIPRDGVFRDINRQVDLYKKALEWIEKNPILEGRKEKKLLVRMWKKNLMGVLEADSINLKRVIALYHAGVRTFRIYSPEPGTEPLETLKAIRSLERKKGWKSIEIFVGQVVSVKQAQQLEAAGADGIYIGIGGGGRCTTGVRSNVAIDWPQLVWDLRGKIKIPIIVEGGASENIGTTLAIGATGIGVTRIAGGGTIESPGGKRYLNVTSNLEDGSQKLVKYYGGEASARMKAMGGKIGPLGTIPYVEGETTVAELPEGRGNSATLYQRLFLLLGDTVMSLVFQNFESVAEMQDKGAESLRVVSAAERLRRQTH